MLKFIRDFGISIDKMQQLNTVWKKFEKNGHKRNSGTTSEKIFIFGSSVL